MTWSEKIGSRFYEQKMVNCPEKITDTSSDNQFRLKSLDQHSTNLSTLLEYLNLNIAYTTDSSDLTLSHVGTWLNIAGGIDDVIYDSAKFDPRIIYYFCEGLEEDACKESEFISTLLKDLVTFNFIWGALESLIELVGAENIFPYRKNRGKYNSACYYLLKFYEPTKRLLFYDEYLNLLHSRLKLLDQYDKALGEFKLRKYVGISGVALSAIKHIRHKFAHGSLKIPERDEYGSEMMESEVIQLSSRLLLFTIQMLLIAFLKTSNLKVGLKEDHSIDFNSDEIVKEIPLIDYLRNLHLDSTEEDPDQILLF